MTFTLPRPPQKPLINGELHLQWTGQPQPPPAVVATRRDAEDEREHLDGAMRRLTPAQRRQVKRSAVPVPPSVGPLRPLAAGRAARSVPSLPPPPATPPRLGTPDVASRKLARDEARVRELCRVTSGAPSGLTEIPAAKRALALAEAALNACRQ